jgi:hypothetical protein
VLPQWKRWPQYFPRLTRCCFDPDASARIENLAILPVEHRLVIEQVDLACAAVHEELDNSLGAGSVVDTMGKQPWRTGDGILSMCQEVGQCDGTEAAT